MIVGIEQPKEFRKSITMKFIIIVEYQVSL